MVTEHLTPHDWKEWRRMQALHLMKQEGWKQCDIAVALNVCFNPSLLELS
jgi:hypothetical protein